jgi:hypothetical protein
MDMNEWYMWIGNEGLKQPGLIWSAMMTTVLILILAGCCSTPSFSLFVTFVSYDMIMIMI